MKTNINERKKECKDVLFNQLLELRETTSFELWEGNFSDKNLISLYSTVIESIISINESIKN